LVYSIVWRATGFFSQVLSDYDMVFDTLGGDALIKSFKVLRQGGIAVSVVGPPDIQLTRDWPMPLCLRFAIRMISWKVRHIAKKFKCRYRFMLMRPSGEQLQQIAGLIDNGVIRPVIDRIFTFDKANEAIAYAETGRATGKIVVSRRQELAGI
jgi:NADPH:quinone reductase-like Zn-dependent oxidoreductase